VRAAGAELRQGALTAVHPEDKKITIDHRTELAYDVLVLTVGARPREAVPGALTFRGTKDGPALAELLARVTAGEIRRLVFALPTGASWPLPLYELALMTAEFLSEHLTGGVEIMFATPENRPLELFGPAASDAVGRLLDLREIRFVPGAIPRRAAGGALHLDGGRALEADAVVALPRLEGPPIVGIPQDGYGFVATDELGWVLGLTDVYAAGDLTQFPVKQGGIAAQQADAVASAIAADFGATARPATFKPVLRGLLLTGFVPRFLRAEPGTASVVDTQPLWWPPAKIVGRYLTPFLAEHLGLTKDALRPPGAESVAVDVTLDTPDHSAWSAV
jgi:sulfide:quinone oxidoreductase